MQQVQGLLCLALALCRHGVLRCLTAVGLSSRRAGLTAGIQLGSMVMAARRARVLCPGSCGSLNPTAACWNGLCDKVTSTLV
jgi:hypothetical protein